MQHLDHFDLAFCIRRLPRRLKKVMEEGTLKGRLYVGGGYVRAVVAGEHINDVDVFVESIEKAQELVNALKYENEYVHETDNAFTLTRGLPIQVIHRWTFEHAEEVCISFDFTVCQAVIFYENRAWHSCCSERFYVDLASKRLVYTSPVRAEEAGGSMLRVLKYYQRGYRIPLDSLGKVMARVLLAVDQAQASDSEYGKVITGLLRMVDPSVDPLHEAHLPSTEEAEVPE